jgi:hypothetical protein
MVMRRTFGATVGGVALVLSTALISIAVTPPRVAGPPPAQEGPAPWAAHLAAVDVALQADDLETAQRAWQTAYMAALASRRWEGLAETADAYLRLADATRTSGAPRARALYLSALLRARDAGARDGVLRAAAAFDGLGDREVAAQARGIAARLP